MSSIAVASDALKLKRMSNGPDAHAMTVSTALFCAFEYAYRLHLVYTRSFHMVLYVCFRCVT